MIAKSVVRRMIPKGSPTLMIWKQNWWSRVIVVAVPAEVTKHVVKGDTTIHSHNKKSGNMNAKSIVTRWRTNPQQWCTRITKSWLTLPVLMIWIQNWRSQKIVVAGPAEVTKSAAFSSVTTPFPVGTSIIGSAKAVKAPVRDLPHRKVSLSGTWMLNLTEWCWILLLIWKHLAINGTHVRKGRSVFMIGMIS